MWRRQISGSQLLFPAGCVKTNTASLQYCCCYLLFGASVKLSLDVRPSKTLRKIQKNGILIETREAFTTQGFAVIRYNRFAVPR